ncbi:hypothetical protein, partial [Streptomyces halstedii]
GTRAEPSARRTPGASAVPGQVSGQAGGDLATRRTPAVATLVRGPAGLMAAVERLVRDMVVVGTLEDAEELV